MKKIFRMVMVCALAGVTLLYTGCTKDYSPELSDINKRVTALEQDTKVGQLEERISTLANSINELKDAKTKLEAAINAKANQSDLTDLTARVAALEGKVNTLQQDLVAATTALTNYKKEVAETYATKKDVADTYATKKELNDKAGELSQEIKTKIASALEGYYSKEDINNLLGNYITKEDLATKLADYYTKAQIASIIADYSTTADVKGFIANALKDYYTRAEMDQILNDYVKGADLNTILAGYYTKADVDQLLAGYYTAADVDQILAGYYTAEQIDSKFSGYYTSEKVDELIQTLDGKLGGQIESLQNETKCIRKAIAHLGKDLYDLKQQVEGITTDIDDILEGLGKMLGAIMNTVQSVVFVPEFDDLCANGSVLLFEGEGVTPVGGPIISGTFQVKPERLASVVAADFAAGKKDVYMQLVNTVERTKAAAGYIKSDTLKIVSFDNNTGYINVAARFPEKTDEIATVAGQESKPVVSLWIVDPLVEKGPATEANEEEEPTSLGSICSIYVPVVFEEKYISADDFVYATVDEDGNTVEYGHDPDPQFQEIYPAKYSKTETMPWNDHSQVNFHEGYQPMVSYDGEFYTCEDFEELFFLPEGAATPVVAEKKVDYWNGGKEEEFVFTSSEEGIDEVIFAIADDSEASWLAHNAVSTQKWEVCGNEVFGVADRFIIGWITTETEITEEETVNWTYDFAVKHSNTPEIPYGKVGEKTENVQPIEFEGKAVDPTIVDTDALEAVTDAKVYSYDSENDAWVEVPGMTVAYSAFDDATVDIKLSGYSFTTDAPVRYKAVASFNDVENASRTQATYYFNLGTKPTSFEETVDITIDYLPKVTTTQALAPEMPEDVKDELLLYFKDNQEFLMGLAKSTVESNTCKVTSAGVEKDASQYSYLLFSEENGVQTRLSQADVKTYADTYVYVAEISTWYNVNYKVTVNATLAEPGYSLAYWPDMVNLDDPTKPYAVVKGKYALNPTETGAGRAKLTDYNVNDQVLYIINRDDLSKYYRVKDKENITDEEKDLLTIVYKVVTVEDIPAGYKNVPTVDSTPKPLQADFGIPSERVDWGDYSARDLDVVAELYCNNVLVTALPLTLNILDPIAKFEVKNNVMEVERENYQYAYAYLWKNFNITGVLEPDFCIINNDAHNAKAAFLYGNPYQAVLTFDDDDLETYIGDEPFEMVGTKITYNAKNGWIRYNDESAWMQKPVKVKVKASLQHKFNYLWPEQDTADSEKNHVESVEFWVVFKQSGVTPTPNAHK